MEENKKDEMMDSAKEKAEQAKKMATETADKIKNMSGDEVKKAAQEKMDKFNSLDKNSKFKYIGIGVAAVVALVLIFGGSKDLTPTDVAQEICELQKDGQLEELFSHTEFNTQQKFGKMSDEKITKLTDGLIRKMKDADCSEITLKQTSVKRNEYKSVVKGTKIEQKFSIDKEEGTYSIKV